MTAKKLYALGIMVKKAFSTKKFNTTLVQKITIAPFLIVIASSKHRHPRLE